MTTDTRIPQDPKHHARSQSRLLRRYPELRELPPQDRRLAVDWAKRTLTRIGLRRGALAWWISASFWLVAIIPVFTVCASFTLPLFSRMTQAQLQRGGLWYSWLNHFASLYYLAIAMLLLPLGPLLASGLSVFLVRRGLGGRDKCQSCRYTLSATTLSGATTVECSESGTSIHPWPNERTDKGMFAPWKPSIQHHWRPLWPFFAYLTTLMMLAASIYSGYGSARLVYRYQVHQDAKLARSWMPADADFKEVLARLGPAQTEDRRFADSIVTIRSHLDEITRRIDLSLPPSSNPRHVDIDALMEPNPSDEPDTRDAQRFTQMVLDQWLAEGGEEALLGLLEYPVVSVTITSRSESNQDKVSASDTFTHPVRFQDLRYFTRISLWMARRAIERGDFERAEMQTSLINKFAFQSISSPTGLNFRLAVAIRFKLLNQLHEQLSSIAILRSNSKTLGLNAVSRILENNADIQPALEAAIACDSLSIRRDIAIAFANHQSILDGSYEQDLRKNLSNVLAYNAFHKPNVSLRIGRFEENRLAAEGFAKWLRDTSDKPRWLRSPPPSFEELLHLAYIPQAFGRVLDIGDEHQQSIIALQCLIALERYRLVNNDYPASLDELEGGPFIDLYNHGKPLQYRKQSTIGRTMFLLYSVGFDGIDQDAEIATTYPLMFNRGNGASDNVFSPDWNQPPVAPHSP